MRGQFAFSVWFKSDRDRVWSPTEPDREVVNQAVNTLFTKLKKTQQQEDTTPLLQSPRPQKTSTVKLVFAALDRNKNGYASAAEIDSFFNDRLDINGDGYVVAEEMFNATSNMYK